MKFFSLGVDRGEDTWGSITCIRVIHSSHCIRVHTLLFSTEIPHRIYTTGHEKKIKLGIVLCKLEIGVYEIVTDLVLKSHMTTWLLFSRNLCRCKMYKIYVGSTYMRSIVHEAWSLTLHMLQSSFKKFFTYLWTFTNLHQHIIKYKFCRQEILFFRYACGKCQKKATNTVLPFKYHLT